MWTRVGGVGVVTVSRALGVGVLLVAGCARQASWTIDVAHLAETTPEGVFVADVIRQGETLRRVVLEYPEATSVHIEDAFEVGEVYGIVAFADLDGDRRCSVPPTDLGWGFSWYPRTTDGFSWEPELDQADSIDACFWYGLGDVRLESYIAE